MSQIISRLSEQEVNRIKAMDHDELVAHAVSHDLAVIVEASLRLHETTKRLNLILIFLTVALVGLTAVLVYFANVGIK